MGKMHVVSKKVLSLHANYLYDNESDPDYRKSICTPTEGFGETSEGG